jgi:hypothetical protein
MLRHAMLSVIMSSRRTRWLIVIILGVVGPACSSSPPSPAGTDAEPPLDSSDASTLVPPPEGGPALHDGGGVHSDQRGDQRTDAAKVACVVHTHTLPALSCQYLHEIAFEIVPLLEGTRDQKLTSAARVAWWSLKEGILSLKNPYVYSNCNFTTGDKTIGPLETCPSGRAWQVGISASQVPGTKLATLEGLATKLYAGSTVAKVLEQAAQKAALDAATTQKVVASTGTLRNSWLLRAGAIGFANQAPVVTSECVTQSLSWCYGSGWSETKLYAPTKQAALKSIEDIKAIFGRLLP